MPWGPGRDDDDALAVQIEPGDSLFRGDQQPCVCAGADADVARLGAFFVFRSDDSGLPPGRNVAGWGPAYPPAGGQYIGGGPRQVQPDIFYDSDSPIDLIIAETLRRSWMRVEYIGWNIKDPGNRLLGAEMDTLDARVPFQAFDPGNVARTNVNGVVQDTGDISFDNLNGMRLTFGAPTQWGSFEADVWGVISGSQTLSVDPVFDPATLVTTIPAVTMTVNGAASDTSMILFDNGYDAELRSGMWGAQGNWIANPLTPQNALVLSPVVGIRYVKFNEELRISGSDLASGTNPRISSKSNNNVVGPQVGFRASMDSKWFSMGLEPKVMFAINRHQDTVRASDIWDSANGDAYESKEDTDFAPGFNLPAYAKVHLGENFQSLPVMSSCGFPTSAVRRNRSCMTRRQYRRIRPRSA